MIGDWGSIIIASHMNSEGARDARLGLVVAAMVVLCLLLLLLSVA